VAHSSGASITEKVLLLRRKAVMDMGYVFQINGLLWAARGGKRIAEINPSVV